MAKADTDREHPYGHGKIEYITSIIIGTIIMIIGISLIINAINTKVTIFINNYVIIIVLIVIIVKYLLSRYVIYNGKNIRIIFYLLVVMKVWLMFYLQLGS